VVIPTYQRETVLCQTIELLLRQDYPNYEIIVVDQSKAHLAETTRRLHDYGNVIRYLQIARPSLPRARNVGAQVAKGEIILYVDDDIVPSSSLVRNHAAIYNNPIIGCVAGQVVPPDGAEVDTSAVGTIVPPMRITRNFNARTGAFVAHAPGGNMSIRRDALRTAGLFDPAFGGTSIREETDLCLRIRACGYKIWFEPSASLQHLAVFSGGCGNRRIRLSWYYWYIHNNAYLAFRHPAAFARSRVLIMLVSDIVQDFRGLLLLPLFLPALIHVTISGFLSRNSLAQLGEPASKSVKSEHPAERR
jgi:GT2 family glycosyltransferase